MEKLTSLKEKSAWANNQTTLNKLGETDGNLTFNGKPVGMSTERPTAHKEFTQSDENFSWVVDAKILYVLFMEESADIPNGTEIANVEFMFSNSEEVPNNVYISLFEMFSYGNAPCIPMTKKVYYDANYGSVVTAIYFPGSLNKVANEIENYRWTLARITYYTD